MSLLDSPLPVEPNTEQARLVARVNALRALQDIARELTAELDLDRLLHKILRSAVGVMDCTAGSLLLLDPATSELVFQVVEGGGGQALENRRIPADLGIAGAALTTGSPVVVADAAQDNRHLGSVASDFRLSVQALIAVPLIAQGKAIGVLEVMNRKSGKSFTAEDQDLLLAIASQSAIAIENARLYSKVIQERDRILQVEAGVRHQIARDLHDGPAQILSAIVMNIRYLDEVFRRSPDHVGAEIQQLEALAQKALYQVRNILFDLRPTVLEAEGLGPALNTFVERLRLVEPFSVDLEMSALATRFKPSVESVIFAIIQEAVNNAKRHAAPHHIWIKAIEGDGQLLIRVVDDGCGFDVPLIEKTTAKENRLGLLNMRERAEIAHGELEIQSQPGSGTIVTLRVPLEGR
jgi:signal transduction histidine kinase